MFPFKPVTASHLQPNSDSLGLLVKMGVKVIKHSLLLKAFILYI